MQRPSLIRPSGLQKLHLLDEHLLGIGYVAVRAGQLDGTVERIVERAAMAAFVPKLKKMILDLSVPKKIDLVGEWLENDLPLEIKEIRQFVSKVHATRTERDDVIHRSWGKTEKDDIKQLVDRRKVQKPKPVRQVTASYLLDLGERLLSLSLDFSDWQMKGYEALIAARPQSLSTLAQLTQPPSFSAMSRSMLRAVKTRAQQQTRQPGPSKS